MLNFVVFPFDRHFAFCRLVVALCGFVSDYKGVLDQWLSIDFFWNTCVFTVKYIRKHTNNISYASLCAGGV